MGFTYTAVNSSSEVCIYTAHADCDYDDFDETEDAENAQQDTLNELQIDAVMDLISDVPSIEITVKANMPYLEIDWD